MKIHDVIHGFAIRAVHELSEIRGKLWEMEHVKSGAKLVWLDRKDENKTFSITFRTLPSEYSTYWSTRCSAVRNTTR